MTENSEEVLMIDLKLSDFRRNNQIEKYINLINNIKTINRIGSDGNVTLHITSCHGYNEIK